MYLKTITTYRRLLLFGLIAGFFTIPVFGQINNGDELTNARSAYIEGLAAFENEEYERALDLLTTSYVKLPDHAGVNFALADAYLQVDDLTNAAYYGKQAAKLEPENKWYHLKLAEIYRKAGKNQSTIDELRLALEYHPNDTDILYELARTFTSQGELLKSNELYNRLIKIQGSSINLHLQKLKNFRDLGMRDSSVAQLQKIRDLDPDNLSTLQLLSDYYQQMNRMEEAKEVLKSALKKNRRNPKTLIMLSDIYRSESQWDSMAVMLKDIMSDTLVSADSKLTVARYMYSHFKQNSGNPDVRDATGTVLEQFRQTEHDFGQAHEMSAEFYVQTKQNELALDALEKTTELMPSSDSAWRQRLQLLLSAGKTKEAIAAGEKAAEEIPQDAIILYFLGNAYLTNGDNAKAVERLVEAADLPARKQLKSSILGSLGDAYAGLERWDEVFESYEKSLEMDSGNPVVLNNYAYFLSLREKELKKAQQMAQKALELDPENPSYLDTMGWIYFKQEDFEKARKYIKASLDSGRESAEVMEHMGDVMDKLNKPDEAKLWWEKALETDSTRTYLKDKISG